MTTDIYSWSCDNHYQAAAIVSKLSLLIVVVQYNIDVVGYSSLWAGFYVLQNVHSAYVHTALQMKTSNALEIVTDCFYQKLETKKYSSSTDFFSNKKEK